MPETRVVESLAYPLAPAVYDAVYRMFRADVEVHVREARGAGGPVLEGCCGTGRLLVPMAAAGVDVDGFDGDARMIEATRAKLAAQGLRASLAVADMRTFALPRRYAQVHIGFNSFYHNLTQPDQLATLARCREHLIPGGHLVLIAFHPRLSILVAHDGTEKLQLDDARPDGGRMRAWDVTDLDPLEQVVSVQRRIEIEAAPGAAPERHAMAFRMRYIWKPEMELLLERAGFARWEALTPFTDMKAEHPFDVPQPARASEMLLWRAWRDDA